MKIVYVLWIFTSNYYGPIEPFPNPIACAAAAVQMHAAFSAPPKPFLFRLACLEHPIGIELPSPRKLPDGPVAGDLPHDDDFLYPR